MWAAFVDVCCWGCFKDVQWTVARVRFGIACMLYKRWSRTALHAPGHLATRELFVGASRGFGREVLAAREAMVALYA